MSRSTILHATAVAIDGAAVLIEGASGTGKSDLALRLIDRGAVLISDDGTELTIDQGVLWARAPATIMGKMEVRGLGIVSMDHAGPTPVALLVTLGEPERMPEPAWRTLCGATVPVLTLAPSPASAPIKVEMALQRLREREA